MTYVNDGDTFRAGGRSRSRSRSSARPGINAPGIAHDGNLAQCYGTKATELARGLVGGRQVTLARPRPGAPRQVRASPALRRRGGKDLGLGLLRAGAPREFEPGKRPVAPEEPYLGAQAAARKERPGAVGPLLRSFCFGYLQPQVVRGTLRVGGLVRAAAHRLK